MAKAGEKTYFKEIGADGMSFALGKPFSDPANVGSLLHDIAAVFTLMPAGPPAKILDLGCGTGWTSNFYAQAGYEVLGVDISPEAVKAAQGRFVRPGLKLKYVCADYDLIGKKYAGTYDCAIFFDSLHHAEDETLALKAAYDALKPGGCLIACEPGRGHSKTAASIEAMQKYGVNERDMPPTLVRKQAKNAGFTDIKVYAYPALIHRSLYKNYTASTRKIFNLPVVRGANNFLLASLIRSQHGIVIARKP